MEKLTFLHWKTYVSATGNVKNSLKLPQKLQAIYKTQLFSCLFLYLLSVKFCTCQNLVYKLIGITASGIPVLADGVLIIFLIAFQQHKVGHMMFPDVAVTSVFFCQ